MAKHLVGQVMLDLLLVLGLLLTLWAVEAVHLPGSKTREPGHLRTVAQVAMVATAASAELPVMEMVERRAMEVQRAMVEAQAVEAFGEEAVVEV